MNLDDLNALAPEEALAILRANFEALWGHAQAYGILYAQAVGFLSARGLDKRFFDILREQGVAPPPKWEGPLSAGEARLRVDVEEEWIYTLVIETKYGYTVYPCATSSMQKQRLWDFVNQSWAREMGAEPLPADPEEVIERYFEAVEEESYLMSADLLIRAQGVDITIEEGLY